MNANCEESVGFGGLKLWNALPYVAGAVVSFHLALAIPSFGIVIIGFVFCLLQISKLSSARLAFYAALIVGLLVYAPQLAFFWNIFHAAAIPLWLVLAFWVALFVLLAGLVWRHVPPKYAWVVIPFLWTGLEYFRSELYYLRFSWLSIGYIFSSIDRGPGGGVLGLYGIGFALTAVAALLFTRKKSLVLVGIALAVVLASSLLSFGSRHNGVNHSIRVSGVQLEFREDEVLKALERVRKKYPQTDLYVLSEYTFNGPPPRGVMNWCRTNKIYLVAGGKDEISKTQFYNTAFVIGPAGETIFKQVKSVPIQFFADGLPAPKQELWSSPWGKIGICICYDLSYRRVVDKLVDLGAEALIVPTMDVVEWGKHQHELHGRVAPMRAAEYGIPIFRLCSSGISQAVEANGRVVASASFPPGEDELISASLQLAGAGRLPIDRWLAPASALVTGLFVLSLVVINYRKRSITRTA